VRDWKGLPSALALQVTRRLENLQGQDRLKHHLALGLLISSVQDILQATAFAFVSNGSSLFCQSSSGIQALTFS
jgi:hypothetical protein